jgi:MFS transporter, OFA family, oxalate/formate antiporter
LKRNLLAIALASMFSVGCLDILRGIASPDMQTDWHLTYFQLGAAFSSGSAGYLAGSFLGGFFADKLGIKPLIFYGGAITSLGIVMLVLLQGFVWFVMGFILIGVGGGIFEIGANDVVPMISHSSGDESRYFHWLHGFYGLGATLFPLVGVWVIHQTHSWRSGYSAILILLFIILVFTILLRYRASDSQHHEKAEVQTPVGHVLQAPALYGLLAAIMTYVMAEIGLATWLPSYLMNIRNLTLAQGSAYLSGFYLLFTIGRLTGHLWVYRIGNSQAVILSAFVSILTLAFAVYGSNHLLLMFVVSGAGFATIFPTITAIASETYREHAGKVLGFLFTASGIGGFLTNWLIGQTATQFGLRTGFSLIFVFLLFTVISMMFVIRLSRTRLGAT